MAKAGTGWEEAGSYTLESRIGNAWNPETESYDRTVYYHNPETGETFNSLGMPNKGLDVMEQEIPAMAETAHRAGDFYKPLIVNVAPVTDEPASESLTLVTRAYEAGADAVLLNGGCPNVITNDGGRHEVLSHNVEALKLTLNGLRSTVEKFQPIFIRLSPMNSATQMNKITQVIRASGVVSVVFTPNTWPSRPVNERGEPIINVPGGIAGKSGPATAPEAHRQMTMALHGLQESGISVVGSGGIMNGRELTKRLHSGAAAAAGTTFYYESVKEGWSEATDRLLRQFAETF